MDSTKKLHNLSVELQGYSEIVKKIQNREDYKNDPLMKRKVELFTELIEIVQKQGRKVIDQMQQEAAEEKKQTKGGSKK